MQEMRFTVAWAVLYSCLVKWDVLRASGGQVTPD